MIEKRNSIRYSDQTALLLLTVQLQFIKLVCKITYVKIPQKILFLMAKNGWFFNEIALKPPLSTMDTYHGKTVLAKGRHGNVRPKVLFVFCILLACAAETYALRSYLCCYYT